MTLAGTRSTKRERWGWYFYDWANSPFYSSTTTVFGALSMSSIAAEDAKSNITLNGDRACLDAAGHVDTLNNCDVSLFGLHFPAGSVWGYLLSVATVVQVLVLPIAGAVADRSHNKRRILGGFAFLGAVAAAAMFFFAGSDWQLGVVLFIVANIGYGGSLVVYYSFLVDIGGPDERDDISAKGWAFGYLGGGLALALQLGFYLGHDAFGVSQGLAVQICFLTSGLWWAAFTVPAVRALPRRHTPVDVVAGRSVLRAGFAELKQTVVAAKAYPLTLAFLGSYLVFTDGINTVVTVSAQYGKDELRFGNEVLIVTILVIQFVAYLGGTLHGLAARRVGAKKTIMGSLVLWVVVLAGAYFVQPKQLVQFLAVAVGIGLVLGGTNALSRSLFSQMIPAGKDAQYYSLYVVGERGTSWLGPLLFAGVGQATGSFRLAIVALVIFFAAGLVLVWLVPVRRAIVAAGNTPPEVL
ncbi:MFS transporter [Amycolatopsis sp. OK19-0408]|uniref:MFS transporter n=1 Tax=Amycolatopsis iheyensis TaxID=2945988 RepID=A0A9X2N7J1_9PSEU|nr:MFS transporter [Amycolatopsis iheyensis]MCR6482278.1 MFS transporter [Amycolatopsis iheyensis]